MIIATGATWATDGLNGVSHGTIPGADVSMPNILTPEQIMVEGKRASGESVLVYDCDGYFMGVSLVERPSRKGKQVTFVTPLAQVAPYTELTLELPRIRRTLLGLGVRLVVQQEVTGIEPGRVTGCDIDAVEETSEWDAESVVLVTQRVSNERPFRELEENEEVLRDQGVNGLYRIGDCVAPRLVADVIFDGHRLAREIGSENPAESLPFIREHRVLGARDEDYDAVCLDAMNDPGMSALRSILDIPVIGPGRASYLIVLMLGNRFSIVTYGNPESRRLGQHYPNLYRSGLLEAGLMDRCASIRQFDVSLDVEHLLDGREADVYPLMVEACLQCIEDGADVICLGSTTMHAAGPHLAEKLPVPAINPGPLTYKLAGLVLGLGLTHSRIAYRKPQAPKHEMAHAMQDAAAQLQGTGGVGRCGRWNTQPPASLCGSLSGRCRSRAPARCTCGSRPAASAGLICSSRRGCSGRSASRSCRAPRPPVSSMPSAPG